MQKNECGQNGGKGKKEEEEEIEQKVTLGPTRWRKMPLSENPTSAPIEELIPHKLCMSLAREG
jgi:hypothetical protein